MNVRWLSGRWPGQMARGFCAAAALAALLGGAGCHTPGMKGTPFFSGEYGKRNGPAENRVNLWPLVYYRDPALSVCWPVFEHTDEHFAVRPLFSVYGTDRTNRQYNVLWPLMQFDRQDHENRIFPFFWRNGAGGRPYFTAFPLYWHGGHPVREKEGYDALFPAWVYSRHGTNDFTLFAPWPLVYAARHHDWSERQVFPVAGSKRTPQGYYRYAAWPLAHQWVQENGRRAGTALIPLWWQERDKTNSIFLSPLWMQGRDSALHWQALLPLYFHREDGSEKVWATLLGGFHRDMDQRTYMVYPLLSWYTHRSDGGEAWALAPLGHARWDAHGWDGHLFPFFLHKQGKDGEFFTLPFGWQRGKDGFVYFATPLAGVHTGGSSGGWLFPLFSRKRDVKTGDTDATCLLLGGHERHGLREQTWFFPLFNATDHGPRDAGPKRDEQYATRGQELSYLLLGWNRDLVNYRPDYAIATADYRRLNLATNAAARAKIHKIIKQKHETAPIVREERRTHGFFPLWNYERNVSASNRLVRTEASVLLFVYDCKRESGMRGTNDVVVAHEYRRQRVLWRLWHSERLDGGVTVDAFPGFTYDRKPDGFRKTSFLWRFFRDERAADGGRKVDLLFVPVWRAKGTGAAQ